MGKKEIIAFINANQACHLATIWTMETNMAPKTFIKL